MFELSYVYIEPCVQVQVARTLPAVCNTDQALEEAHPRVTVGVAHVGARHHHHVAGAGARPGSTALHTAAPDLSAVGHHF